MNTEIRTTSDSPYMDALEEAVWLLHEFNRDMVYILKNWSNTDQPGARREGAD